ncbi:MAG: DNA-directed RNA polymerase subunit beta' [Clostridia bacterium]|nr:DNA-directed RNA polymerase subunit beta' [Clostridia bacterium]
MANMTFEAIKIGLASPEKIEEWSYGEVKKPETINYRTLKPERDGLYCERIFGPTKDWECHCGKYKKVRFKGKICDRCGVEVTKAKVRRERMGHIELAAPVSHIWYFKGIPSRMGLVLDMSPRLLEKVLYFASYIVTDPGEGTPLQKGQILSEREYRDMLEKYEDDFKAEMGAEAIKKLLATVGLTPSECARKLDLMDQCEKMRLKIRDLKENGADPEQIAQLQASLRDLKAQRDAICGLDALSEQLREELREASGQKKARISKRLEVIEAFRMSGNRPEWMVLDNVPVLPPDLRPMVQLDGGRFATSDLNDLYRRVINRNNRLERLLKLGAPDIIVRNEKRMLQEAVDALIDNGRRGRPVTGPNNRPLKSLSDMLKGKQGRFRQNLLGKRVDYSGRSVIVVGPELKMYQCGLPKEMALELFKPFVMKKLVEDGLANNIKSAKKMVERAKTEVWDALEHVIKDHPVMLNRAPTLHRLGIQAFEPILVEGRAIKLHPLVCTAFNADFDGDQMAVHVPLSAEAQAEARLLMLSANNLLKPQDGSPVAVPNQDIVLGCYYMTIDRCEAGADKRFESDADAMANGWVRNGADENGVPLYSKFFTSVDEALLAYDTGVVGIHSPIKVRMEREIDGVRQGRVVNATVGRLIFNAPLPQDLGFVDRSDPEHAFDLEVGFTVGKKELGKIITACIKKHGFAVTSEVLDKVKELGYKYSTIGALTVSAADMSIPEAKYTLVAETEKRVAKIEKDFKRGKLTDDERYRAVIEEWDQTTKDVTKAMIDNLDRFNPIFMMSTSGARGSTNQIRQLAGMRGLMANTAGKTIELPIKANFREGLSVLEYFISSRGARKGLADTALRTADSGYLTRRLVDVSQDVIIREDDCGTEEGIWIHEIKDGNQVIEPFADRIIGRYPVYDIVHPETGEVLVEKGTLMEDVHAKKIMDAGIEKVYIRSVLKCRARHGICAKCYGSNLASDEAIGIGEAVGIIAAQSIGEPGTQLTMRTFHTGGIAGGDITQGLPRVEELFEARKPKKAAVLSEISGIVSVEEGKRGTIHNVKVTNEETRDAWTVAIPANIPLKVQPGEHIERGQDLTDGPYNPHDVLRTRDVAAVHDYLIQEVQRVYRQQGVDINDRHIEVIVRQMMRKIRVENAGDTELLPGSVIDLQELRHANEELEEKARIMNVQMEPATYAPVLMGITKASLATDSFLSAASFQETTRVLTEAAIKGKIDPLMGLKENVIIGKLIPAGSGVNRYSEVSYEEVINMVD